MYKVICNGKTLHDDTLESLRISNASVELELGKTGSFVFTIHTNHPYYDSVDVMSSRLTVYRKDKIIFSGRVLKIEYGFYNEKQVSCEGELAYLLDTLIPSTAFYGSFNEYFEHIVKIHNSQVDASKQFAVGDFTVAEFFPYEVVTDGYSKTWDEIQNKIINVSGGYLQARNENGTRYLDVLSWDANINNTSNQTITFGKNLVDIKRDVDGSEVFTAVIPIGADGISIESVNNYVPYVTNAEAVAKYGLIYKVVNFDTVTDPQTLKTVGQNFIRENYMETTSIDITVADVSTLTDSLDSFLPGQWVNVISKHHFTQNPNLYLVRKMNIGISSPDQTRISVGRMKRGLSDSIAGIL